MEKEYCFFRSNFSLRRIVIIFLLSILSIGSIGYSDSLPAVSVDYVINGMKHRESLVNSARATFTLKITDELNGDSATNEFEWAMKGNSRYLKQLDNDKQEFVETYDGVYYRHYRIRSNSGYIEKTWGLSDTSTVPDIFGFYFYGQPLSKFFEVNKATLLPKTETIEDQECYVIEVIGPAPQKPPIGIQLPDVKIKAWVNPKRGFSVVQLEQGFLHYKLSKIYKMQWKEFGDGLWFPVIGELRSAGVLIELTVNEIKFNIDVSDQLFKNPGWKNNTRIWDDMLQTTVNYNESL